MINFPKHLNTRYDVEVCINLYPEKTKSFLSSLISEVSKWIIDRKLKDGEPGIEDDTHKVQSIEEDGIVKERYQLIYKEDPNCGLFRLGLTLEEAKAMVGK